MAIHIDEYGHIVRDDVPTTRIEERPENSSHNTASYDSRRNDDHSGLLTTSNTVRSSRDSSRRSFGHIMKNMGITLLCCGIVGILYDIYATETGIIGAGRDIWINKIGPIFALMFGSPLLIFIGIVLIKNSKYH